MFGCFIFWWGIIFFTCLCSYFLGVFLRKKVFFGGLLFLRIYIASCLLIMALSGYLFFPVANIALWGILSIWGWKVFFSCTGKSSNVYDISGERPLVMVFKWPYSYVLLRKRPFCSWTRSRQWWSLKAVFLHQLHVKNLQNRWELHVEDCLI